MTPKAASYIIAACAIAPAILIAATVFRMRDLISINDPRPELLGIESNSGTGAGMQSRAAALIDAYKTQPPNRFSQYLHYWLAVGGVPGATVSFHELSGIDSLLNGETFQKQWAASYPLIEKTPVGLRIRRAKSAQGSFEGIEGESHVDQTIAMLAELGADQSTTIRPENYTVTVGSLLASSRADFVIEQELPWSAVAYCLYLPKEPEWTNRFGQRFSYAIIADELLRVDLGIGACHGSHPLYALTVMWNADCKYDFLPWRTRSGVLHRLQEASAKLAQNQASNGAWDEQWYLGTVEQPNNKSLDNSIDRLVSVTAHHLEWMLRAPARARPGSTVINDAVRFLIMALERGAVQSSGDLYCPRSHAIRVLTLATQGVES